MTGRSGCPSPTASGRLRRALAIGCLAAWMLAPIPLVAQPDAGQPDESLDYAAENRDWNGLSELVAAERALGRVLHLDGQVDLSAHAVDQPIAIVYPTESLPVADLIAFVAQGGRLLVADDFGSAGPLIRELGLIRLEGPAPHGEALRGNEELPVLRRAEPHPLLADVRVVVANHPAVLTPARPTADDEPPGPFAPGLVEPILVYDEPAYGLLYDVRLGEGRALVLGDPSVLINFMREVADNGGLARNLFGALCEGQELCAVTLVTGSRGRFAGRFPGPRPTAPGRADRARTGDRVERSVRRGARNVNEALSALTELRPSRRGVYFAAVFLSIGVCVFLFSALPLGRPRWLSFSLRLPKGVRSRSEFEWNLERLLEGGRNDDFGLPLAILKDEFEELFLGELAQHRSELQPERRYDPDQMTRFARRFAERVAPEGSATQQQAAAQRALSTLRLLARIPARNSLVPEVDGRYSERLLKRVYLETRSLLDDLGMLDTYERRAGRP